MTLYLCSVVLHSAMLFWILFRTIQGLTVIVVSTYVTCSDKEGYETKNIS